MGNPVFRTMVRGEEVMPIPGGEITTSQIWTTPEAVEEPKPEQCDCEDGCEGCKDVGEE